MARERINRVLSVGDEPGAGMLPPAGRHVNA
jgi:hypothetical protein